MPSSVGCSRTMLMIRVVLPAFVLLSALSGCAVVPAPRFVDEAGVQVDVRLMSGESLHGRLVSLEPEGLAIEHALPKNEETSIVRRGGEDFVVVGGRTVGSAVEARAFDIVVRERVRPGDVEDLRVASRAYVGWGTLIAAVLSDSLVKVVATD